MVASISVDAREGGEYWITIDRIEKHNALARSVLGELSQAVSTIGERDHSRFIVLRGAGNRFFAAGGDLRDLESVRDASAVAAMGDAARGALDSVRDCRVPVIAFVNGDALGGGSELAVACDLRLQAGHARLGFIQSRMAITSAWGGGPDLCALVGPARALRMMARAEMVDAATALAWGLADAVVDDGADGATIASFLEPLRRCPAQVLRGIKAQTQAIRRGEPYETRRAIERRHLESTWLHEDHWACVNQFLSKGKA
ncbi:enoyl-CoA hydratase/isomerase family protein [soil metagenome]